MQQEYSKSCNHISSQQINQNITQEMRKFDLETQIRAGDSYSRLQVNSELSSLGKVLSWFESLKDPLVPRRIWIECQTVLGEAFDNVVIHAHKDLPSTTTVEIGIKILSQLIIIKVWDQGPGFDLESQRYKVSQGVDDYAEHGRGVQILEKVADYFSYFSVPNGRNCLLILKFFDEQSHLNHQPLSLNCFSDELVSLEEIDGECQL
ncbi:MAG: anti-sigma regulatory factor [Cyanobacteria bacterium P01_F01_bin.143]